MANATPVHKPEGTDVKKKPLSKDAQKIKLELEKLEQANPETPAAPVDPVGPGTTKTLADGTVVRNF